MKIERLSIALLLAASASYSSHAFALSLISFPSINPFDISADGSVVVGDYAVRHPARWSESAGFEVLNEAVGNARAVSGDGNVIVGMREDSSTASAIDAFRWTRSSGFQALGGLNDTNDGAEAKAASFDGSVVVGRASYPRASSTSLGGFHLDRARGNARARVHSWWGRLE